MAQRADWHLAIAGDGPSRSWLLEQIARQPYLREKTHWLGQRDDIPGLAQDSQRSRSRITLEGMPNAILEAMAARLPVIGSAVEGTEDLIIPGQTGWLCRRDPEAFVAPCSKQLIHLSVVCDMGQQARRRVEREFSLARTVEADEHLWGRVLGLQLPEEQASPTNSSTINVEAKEPVV